MQRQDDHTAAQKHSNGGNLRVAANLGVANRCGSAGRVGRNLNGKVIAYGSRAGARKAEGRESPARSAMCRAQPTPGTYTDDLLLTHVRHEGRWRWNDPSSTRGKFGLGALGLDLD